MSLTTTVGGNTTNAEGSERCHLVSRQEVAASRRVPSSHKQHVIEGANLPNLPLLSSIFYSSSDFNDRGHDSDVWLVR